jgi:hypothetical protein
MNGHDFQLALSGTHHKCKACGFVMSLGLMPEHACPGAPLLQDQDRKLSNYFATKPEAMLLAREAAIATMQQTIANERKLREQAEYGREELRQKYIDLQCELASLCPAVDGDRANDNIMIRVRRHIANLTEDARVANLIAYGGAK